jgi:hypothetical protein
MALTMPSKYGPAAASFSQATHLRDQKLERLLTENTRLRRQLVDLLIERQTLKDASRRANQPIAGRYG